MSGHSKWHSIRFKKGIADAKRGKVFTKHAKLIAIAARAGGDPDMNPALRTAIENAKAENMPNINIERAIKKGTGEDKDAAQIVEAVYEGYGPGGTALLIQTLSDNKNRTVANMKHIMSKHGGNLGETGSVAYLFDRKGTIVVSLEDKDPEEAELAAIDAGCADAELDDGSLTLYTAPNELIHVKDNIADAGYKVESTILSYIAKNSVRVDNEETARKVLKLMDALDEDEDVGEVYSNFDIDESIMEKLS
ncbi:MAG: YebC/PmpR family DNA-binding transcriptional regulator [Patescibacteria group bacterium]|nr:YebC/PmpR family DNA-binding transcriptional regulator [Patescibacteria group bacterium]